MVPEGLTTFNLCAEYNRSFDDNETYTAKATKFNGQPSVIYACRVDLKNTARRFDTLKCIGRGGQTGSDPALYHDIEKLTTALKVFSSIVVKLGM